MYFPPYPYHSHQEDLPLTPASWFLGTVDQIARREAWEEIGLPIDDTKLPAPFRIEHLCYLPMNLARTELVVRPCVALLHTNDPPGPTGPASPAAASSPTVEESLIPRLDAKEVAAVFSAPFHNFLKVADEQPQPPPILAGEAKAEREPKQAPHLPPGKWYEGNWTTWHDRPWRLHFFYVPVTNQRVVKPKVRDGGLAALSEHEHEHEHSSDNENGSVESGRYKVWGMTARILVDAATVAYGEQPEFEHNSHFGDEEVIEQLARMGRMGEKKRQASVAGSTKEAGASAEAEVGSKGGTSKM
jgi:8-oxo-dGTP pyrophosphatase MutT (NUDIX family)